MRPEILALWVASFVAVLILGLWAWSRVGREKTTSSSFWGRGVTAGASIRGLGRLGD